MDTNSTHWMAVGEITDHAKLAIKNVGGFVRKADTGPLPVFLVGLPCREVRGQERVSDVRIITWMRGSSAIVEIPSANLKLSWSSTSNVQPTEASISDTVLDVWQEEWLHD